MCLISECGGEAAVSLSLSPVCRQTLRVLLPSPLRLPTLLLFCPHYTRFVNKCRCTDEFVDNVSQIRIYRVPVLLCDSTGRRPPADASLLSLRIELSTSFLTLFARPRGQLRLSAVLSRQMALLTETVCVLGGGGDSRSTAASNRSASRLTFFRLRGFFRETLGGQLCWPDRA